MNVQFDMRKDSLKNSFFEMNKLPKKEPINFCKFYDNDGIFQFLLRSDHFINPNVWYLVFGLNFYDQYSGDDNLSQEHLIVVSIPCHIRKDSFKDTFFRNEQISKERRYKFL